VRPTPRGTVSAPLTWDELAAAEPADFDVRTMPARFAEVGDRHAWLDDVAHDLTPLLEQAERDARAGLLDLR
jgi:DNA primase